MVSFYLFIFLSFYLFLRVKATPFVPSQKAGILCTLYLLFFRVLVEKMDTYPFAVRDTIFSKGYARKKKNFLRRDTTYPFSCEAFAKRRKESIFFGVDRKQAAATRDTCFARVSFRVLVQSKQQQGVISGTQYPVPCTFYGGKSKS